MRQEIALEEDGSPTVRAFRDEEGFLRFRYLAVRPGGMGVWLEVPADGVLAVTGSGMTDEDLTMRLQAARAQIAESIAAGDAAHSEAIAGLTAQNEALGEELEEARAELQVRLDEMEALRRENEELKAGGAAPAKQPRRRAAA